MVVLQKNLAQEEAIETIDGPVIVISCPGSGKTTTLVRRIKNIIDHGADPSRILMITFANSAAKDMQERYIKLYGSNPGVNFMTIHSLCFAILQHEEGYTKSSLISESQKMEFFINQLKNNIYVSDAWEMAKQVITEMSAIRNSYTPLKQYTPIGCDKELFIRLYEAYETEKRLSGKIDFDDMLVKCEELLSTNKELRKKWGSYFDYIQVDEYQDTNQIQKDIIYALIERTKNLCVVGDDDQSLYSWRGADPSIMMTFRDDFLNVKEINMSTNYRSAQKIVDYADTLIKRNKVRFNKDFVSNRGEGGAQGVAEFKHYKTKVDEMLGVIDKIQYLYEIENIDYKDMAILFRTNKQAETPMEQLSRAGIPFSSTEKIKSIYDSYIFKDIQAYVELSMGKVDKHNLYSVLNHPNRYLSFQRLKHLPFTKEAYLKAIEPLKTDKDSWQHVAIERSLIGWFDSLGPGKVNKSTSPSEIMNIMEDANAINYLKHLKSIARVKNSDVQDELDVFDLLREDAERFQTVEAWFKHAAVTTRQVQEANRKRDANGVQLTTMHKSKGLEWKVVFNIGVNAASIPGKLSTTDELIEEERRVLYVAMTRAEDQLYVSSSGSPSRFLRELEEDYKDRISPVTKKKLPGAKVQHVTHGLGKVVRYVDGAVVINFDGVGMKKLLFPESFQKGICKYI